MAPWFTPAQVGKLSSFETSRFASSGASSYVLNQDVRQSKIIFSREIGLWCGVEARGSIPIFIGTAVLRFLDPPSFSGRGERVRHRIADPLGGQRNSTH
jgi:hypothetical protein